jgi:hypothetical protein
VEACLQTIDYDIESNQEEESAQAEKILFVIRLVVRVLDLQCLCYIPVDLI